LVFTLLKPKGLAMADQFLAEIRMFPFNFAPTGWAFCDGQVMSISQNTALFALLGTTYGGDGKTTFALPNLQGSSPLQQGQGQGLGNYLLGQKDGQSTVILTASEIPFHNHTLGVGNNISETNSPQDMLMARPDSGAVYATSSPDRMMNPSTMSVTGGSLPHNNMQPYLTVNFCIALQGVFPPRP
jgi:microcystin-dependent protein